MTIPWRGRTDIAATPTVIDDSGDMTDERVESANERLQREHGAHRGSAKKQRKGKERAGPVRFTATNARAVTSDTDGSFQDEVSLLRPGSGRICAFE